MKKHEKLSQAYRALLLRNVLPAVFARLRGWQMLRSR